MSHLNDIDKAFEHDATTSSSSEGGRFASIPLWGRRAAIAFVLSAIIVLGAKPKAILDLSYDTKQDAIKVKILKWKALQLICVVSVVMYFVVKKYY